MGERERESKSNESNFFHILHRPNHDGSEKSRCLLSISREKRRYHGISSKEEEEEEPGEDE